MRYDLDVGKEALECWRDEGKVYDDKSNAVNVQGKQYVFVSMNDG